MPTRQDCRNDYGAGWVFHSMGRLGEVGALGSQDAARLNAMARKVAEKHGLEGEYPDLLKISTAQARDAWIAHAYESSGHNVLLTQLAAQHADASTLRHYLARRRYRAKSEQAVRGVQNAAFSDFAHKGLLDPTRIRILVQQGHITPEQEERLLDKRQRTRLGMGCLNPTSPPREIVPDHPAGQLCRVQRCTGCSSGIVFDDSLDMLAKAKAEMIHLKANLPLAVWLGSSFEDEDTSLDETLSRTRCWRLQASR